MNKNKKYNIDLTYTELREISRFTMRDRKETPLIKIERMTFLNTLYLKVVNKLKSIDKSIVQTHDNRAWKRSDCGFDKQMRDLSIIIGNDNNPNFNRITELIEWHNKENPTCNSSMVVTGEIINAALKGMSLSMSICEAYSVLKNK